MKSRKILITRSGEECGELTGAVHAAGFEPVHEPLLTIDYARDGWPDISMGAPLIFTSSYGVLSYAAHSVERGHPVYTVGRNTAETARAQGFTNIRSAEGDFGDLVELLSRLPEKELISAIYLRAADVSGDLKQILQEKGISISEFTAYKARPVENLGLNLLKSFDNREIYAVLLFSSRAGQVFADLMEQYGRAVRLKTTKALCISEAVLQSVSVLPFQQGLIARTPDRYGMMELLKDISVT
jgi:uroporphyrinogen-III synthase